jgi:hypothetical protein
MWMGLVRGSLLQPTHQPVRVPCPSIPFFSSTSQQKGRRSLLYAERACVRAQLRHRKYRLGQDSIGGGMCVWRTSFV